MAESNPAISFQQRMPTQSNFPGDSIDAVGGMGWVPRGFPSRLEKKIRKYVYEDYWNMI
jgi:hypothetical protein